LNGDSSATHVPLEIVTTATEQVLLPIARPKRQAKASCYLSEYHCNLIQISETPNTAQAHSTISNIPSESSFFLYPISSVLTYDKLQPFYQSFVLSCSIEIEPHNFKEVMAHPHFPKLWIWRFLLYNRMEHGVWNLYPQVRMLLGVNGFILLNITRMDQ